MLEYDSAREVTIPARGKGFADTDIAIAVPAGTCTSHRSFVHPFPLFLSLFFSVL